MNNSLDIKLSIILYKYMSQNKIINENHSYKKENRINIDNNFKAELKQHFKTLNS